MIRDDIFRLWVYLSASPLFALSATLAAYVLAQRIAARLRHHPLANPVLLTVVLLSLGILAVGEDYQRYFEGAQFVHFLLGPATVAFAIPMAAMWSRMKRIRLALALGLMGGGVAGALSAVLTAWALGASHDTVLALIPKSITTPIAMGITEQIGGSPSLTAVFCILTGIIGAAAGPALLSRFGVTRPAVRGFALGTAAHGIGTARAFQEHPEAGAFAGLALGIHGFVAAVFIPVIVGIVLKFV
ncbi:LrgB family protein [Niveibacterium umoris]|uniref:Putative effector of murein hydrolase n=1 Tax=Niveibacterium umoris TaxID=1193620 RepID=A0A840BH48_9RHOO|nr:LrgB family protein [Niveibacterium umoris]MBB4012525.1 putative effector of murein hydrolase [Niveibacterium umoris]